MKTTTDPHPLPDMRKRKAKEMTAWIPGEIFPTRDGNYLREFDEGTAISEFHESAGPVHKSADRDAYEGAREDLLDWKRRALKAEKDSRRLALVLDWWFGGRPDLDLRRALSPDELVALLDA